MSFAIQSTRSLLRIPVFPTLAQKFTAIDVRRPLGALGMGLGLLGGLLGEMILRAVPKQRTSHSKKRKRMAGKGLKDRHDIVRCKGCGRPKLIAQICSNCYRNIKGKFKAMKREQENAE
ncbi:hypothetical protein GGI25_001843 [Coemansia spiralis]|uniref:Large ribosomal subunit protein bL32m n=2 Tax=Coemansia TaxID=4863 RepID=A0A9W8GBV4_9FUNG|nr:hypothetical protein EDC05_001862 [Coemansia umbellata]KAJ2622716.1 hypothetical protein GGI26_002985 [Coemansia sp. RSA 1358]KAJ2679071.1 hypothetical protein GGI25_001843 [Coemansia spiralis]